MHAERDDAASGDGKAPHLDASVRLVGRAGRETLDSALDTGRALRNLLAADLALSRSALGRALAWVGVAIVFGASAWLLLSATLIALLRATLAWSWLAAIATAALLSLVVTALAAWRVSVFFDHAGMHATRRQLSRLGIGGDESDDDDGGLGPPPPPAPQEPPPTPPAGTA